MNLEEYKHTLIERFSNPQVRDTIARLCAEGQDRIPKWLVPVIQQQFATGGEIRRSAAVVASWARYAEGVDEQGQPFEVVDRLADRLIRAARRQCANPTAFIADRNLFGDLADHEPFVTAYRSALASLHERGTDDTEVSSLMITAQPCVTGAARPLRGGYKSCRGVHRPGHRLPRGQALGRFLRLRQYLLQRKNLGDRALPFGLLDDERAPGQGDTGPVEASASCQACGPGWAHGPADPTCHTR